MLVFTKYSWNDAFSQSLGADVIRERMNETRGGQLAAQSLSYGDLLEAAQVAIKGTGYLVAVPN